MKSILSYLPTFKGKSRLANVVHRNLISRKEPVRITAAQKVEFFVPNLVENVSFELFINGYYEKELVEYLVDRIPRGGCFYDVGANIGAISILVAKSRPDIDVYSFEASPRVFDFLKRNIEINKISNISAFNVAIDVEDGSRRLFYSPEYKFGKGSFKPIFTEESESVETLRLDSFILHHPAPDFVKVDVEGFESLIFASLERLLKSTAKKPEIIFEFVDWAEEAACGETGKAQKLIKELGYRIYDFDEFRKGTMREIAVVTSGCRNLLARKD